jgi:hypothetical protein
MDFQTKRGNVVKNGRKIINPEYLSTLRIKNPKKVQHVCKPAHMLHYSSTIFTNFNPSFERNSGKK